MIMGELTASSELGADWVSKTYFTSDTHFDHNGILKWQPWSRPFDDTEEMDEVIIANWNNTIGADDIVFFLGDLTLGEKGIGYLEKLNGIIYALYIPTHHDRHWMPRPPMPDIRSKSMHSVRFFIENTMIHAGRIGADSDREVRITLGHYPLYEWNGSYHYGQWHLHAHTHGTYESRSTHGFAFDVGMDTNDLKPVPMTTIIDLATRWESRLEKQRER